MDAVRQYIQAIPNHWRKINFSNLEPHPLWLMYVIIGSSFCVDPFSKCLKFCDSLVFTELLWLQRLQVMLINARTYSSYSNSIKSHNLNSKHKEAVRIHKLCATPTNKRSENLSFMNHIIYSLKKIRKTTRNFRSKLSRLREDYTTWFDTKPWIWYTQHLNEGETTISSTQLLSILR